MQPRLGQLPGQGGPSGLSVMWPSSAPSPCAPRKILPPITTPPPTPVPSVSITRWSLAEEVGLGERGAVGVVVHEHGHAEAPAELLAQRHARERDVHARLDRAGGVVDLRGHADADRLGLADPLDHALDDRLDAVQQAPRWCSGRSGPRSPRGRSLPRPLPRRPSCRLRRRLGPSGDSYPCGGPDASTQPCRAALT